MISDEQRTRLQAVINRLPTNPPTPRLSLSELDEIRALIAAGREDDAYAELTYKANAASAAAFEAMKKKGAEMGREMERRRMEKKEHATRMESEQKQSGAVLLQLRKRNALIAELSGIWSTIEKDLSESSRNDLNKAKKGGGDWCIQESIKWAARKGKITKQKAESFIRSDQGSEIAAILRANFGI